MLKGIDRFVSGLPRTVKAAVLVGLSVRLFAFVGLWATGRHDLLVFGDQIGYLTLAGNLAMNGVYSGSVAAPFVPEVFRTPLFPAMVAVAIRIFGSHYPALVVQMLVSAAIPLIGARLAASAKGSPFVVAFVAWFLALEPVAVMNGMMFVSEPLFIFLLLSSLVLFVRGVGDDDAGRSRTIVLSGLALAASMYVRSMSMFLPILLVGVILSIRGVAARRRIGMAAIYLAVFFAALSPWMARNAIVAGKPAFTTQLWTSAYYYFMASTESLDKGVAFHEARDSNKKEVVEGLGVSKAELFSFGAEERMRPIVIDYFRTHPREVVTVGAIATQAFFTNDSYLAYAQRLKIVPHFQSFGSPSLILVQKGPLALIEFVSGGGAYLALPVAGRVIWVLMTLAALVGFVSTVRRGGATRRSGVTFAIVIVYAAAASSLIGFGVEARHRQPVNSMIAFLAAVGIERTFRRRGKASAKLATVPPPAGVASSKIPASVGILTLNNAKELPRTLESVRDFADVYICDGNSTDGTQEVARRYGARVVRQVETDEPNVRITDFGATRTRCVDAGLYDWHLRVDSDEYLSPEAVEEIRIIVADHAPRFLVYKMPRKYVIGGKIIDQATTYPNRQMRFFNRKGIEGYTKVTHERVVVRPGVRVGIMDHCQYAPLPEDYPAFWKKFESGLKFDVKQSADIGFARWIRSSLHTLALSGLYLVRLVAVRFRKGTKMPLRYELARQRYLFLAWLTATRNLFRK